MKIKRLTGQNDTAVTKVEKCLLAMTTDNAPTPRDVKETAVKAPSTQETRVIRWKMAKIYTANESL